MAARVECRSEHQYAQRPTAFDWEGQRLLVREILASWRSPAGWGFRVKTENGGLFELMYQELDDNWIVRPQPTTRRKDYETS